MAAASSKGQTAKKQAAPANGQPAQRAQSSRKGKRAWRKNVDIDGVEQGLEELRAEERVIGTTLQKQKDDDLFVVDVKGDDNIRKTLPKFSERVLTSTKILSQRSAVPAVFARTTGDSAQKRKAPASLTYDEKGRLLRMGKKLKRGPFNAVIDPTQVGEGTAILELSEAAKNAGKYDVWGSESASDVKKPQTHHPRSMIQLAAVPAPHEGTSYNPPLTAHQELLRAAHEIEERKLEGAEELEAMKAKLEKARALAVPTPEDLAPGMTLDTSAPDPEDATEESTELPSKKMPVKKTKQQRRKLERLKAEKRALAEKAARKRMLSLVDSAKAMRKSIARNLATRERLRAQKLHEEREKLTGGLAGQRIGKHKVPEGPVDVQLGEELTESLRELKPEGNLFRDRFVSMQQRALVEPRVPVLPKKRKAKFKEYEKHAWKRFDRER